MYLLHGRGLCARQPTARHTNRTKALMLLAGPRTLVCAKYTELSLLYKQGGEALGCVHSSVTHILSSSA